MAKTFHVDPRPGIILRWVILLLLMAVGFWWINDSIGSRLDSAVDKAQYERDRMAADLKIFTDNFDPVERVEINTQHLDQLEKDFQTLRKSIEELTAVVQMLRQDLDTHDG